MKNFKRIAAMAAAMTLAACAAAPIASFAVDETTGSIIISNEEENHQYVAYQIFKGDEDDGVLSNIAWGAGVNSSATNFISDIQGITLDTAIITEKGKDAVTNPFYAADTAEKVAKVLSDGAYASAEDENPTPFANDAEITKKFAEVIAKYTTGTGKPIVYNTTNKNYAAVDVKVGYYIVVDKVKNSEGAAIDTKAFSRYIVQVLGTPTSVSKKTDYPSVVKKVKENIKYTADGGFGAGFNDVADTNLAEDVEFKLIGTIPTTIGDYKKYHYEFHDTYAAGLFDITDTNNSNSVDAGDFTITIGSTVIPATTSNGINYTFTPKSGNAGFDIEFADILNVYASNTATTPVAITGETTVTVEYKAKLNKANAAIGLNGNENTVKLEYSNNPNFTGESTGSGDNRPDEQKEDKHGETPEDTVIVFTYELDITKYLDSVATGNEAGKDDKEAQFKLQCKEGSQEGKYAVFDTTDTTNPYRIIDWNNAGTALSTATSAGVVKFIGLDDGTYELTETKTPVGYNTMAPLTLIVEGSTVTCQDYLESEDHDAAVEVLTDLKLYETAKTGTPKNTAGDNKDIVSDSIVNHKGATLPSTGGMGTYLFYGIGGALAVGAGMVLATKKRVNK